MDVTFKRKDEKREGVEQLARESVAKSGRYDALFSFKKLVGCPFMTAKTFGVSWKFGCIYEMYTIFFDVPSQRNLFYKN